MSPPRKVNFSRKASDARVFPHDILPLTCSDGNHCTQKLTFIPHIGRFHVGWNVRTQKVEVTSCEYRYCLCDGDNSPFNMSIVYMLPLFYAYVLTRKLWARIVRHEEAFVAKGLIAPLRIPKNHFHIFHLDHSYQSRSPHLPTAVRLLFCLFGRFMPEGDQPASHSVVSKAPPALRLPFPQAKLDNGDIVVNEIDL